ncbi:AzlD domain-containing protein [Tateyamaria omphalii]|uniref:AzlD domain-containing protein n=1 Tax=Tateyamaria omphalii TaxID=299262 RepID=UPI001C99BF88|nr:AzlD domain-containing protein [Tateyamaria omphalii]MBY5931602.1 AzlD domain-containing protein [Tateyamaria omphalii]
MTDGMTLWTVIIGLGVGSFLLRFTFLGFVGDRPLPDWLLRHLRYTAVAILPALAAPLVVYSGENGSVDIARVVAALATLGVGIWTRNVFAAIGAGAVTLIILIYAI